MKVKAPFEVRQLSVEAKSGQSAGNVMYVLPLRFLKMRFLGEPKSRLGNFYKVEHGQFIGWWSSYRGVWSWMPSHTT